MNLEQRVQALEQEVQLLKSQIQQTLLEMQEHLLTHTYPSLNGEAGNGTNSAQPTPAKRQTTAPATYHGPDEDDEYIYQNQNAPKVRQVSLDDVQKQKRQRRPEPAPSYEMEEEDGSDDEDYRPVSRRNRYDDRDERDNRQDRQPERPVKKTKAPASDERPARRQRPQDQYVDEAPAQPVRPSKQNRASRAEDFEQEEPPVRRQPKPAKAKAAPQQPTRQPSAPRQWEETEPDEEDTQLSLPFDDMQWATLPQLEQWVVTTARRVGLARTRKMVDQQAQQGRLNQETRDLLYETLDILADMQRSQANKRKTSQLHAVNLPPELLPEDEESPQNEAQNTQRNVVLRLIAGVANASIGMNHPNQK